MIGHRARSLLLAGIAFAGGPLAATMPADPEGSLTGCRESFAADPEAEAGAECFYLAVRAGVGEESAAAAVSGLLSEHPGHPWLLFYLGALRWSDHERAAELFREARDQFARRGDANGEVRAGSNLARLLDLTGRRDEAEREVARAIERAAGAEDPLMVAQGALLQATVWYRNREDLERARALLHQVEAILFPAGPYGLKRNWLLTAGDVSVELSRTAEARGYFQRARDLIREHDDRYAEPAAIYGLLRVQLEELTDMPRAGGREDAVALAQEAAAAAAAVANDDAEAMARLVVGLVAEPAQALPSIDICLRVAPSPLMRSYCLVARARNLAATHPGQAVAAIEEAIELARRAEDPWSLAFAWSERMRVSWQIGPVERAIADSISALEAIEVLRDLQSASVSRAHQFVTWSEDYRWLAGRLLEQYVRAPDEALLERAFDILERMRARALVDALETANAAPRAAPATTRLQTALEAALEQIAVVQSRLLDPELPAAARREADHKLARLEQAEADLRARIESADPVFAALRRPQFASLAQVREALAADQALLSFQVAPRTEVTGNFGGGGWLLVVTRGGVRVYPTLDRVEIRRVVPTFSGLFEKRNDTDAVPATHLEARLLGSALDDLPAAVEQLIVVPDDALHLLSFAALRSGVGGAPLATRFQLSVVPSATLWLRWRREPPAAATIPALVLADPTFAYATRDSDPTVSPPRLGVLSGSLRLPPLPKARSEGRAVVGLLDGGSVLRLGDEASEAFLKGTDLRRFTLLHFATHAVTDDDNPARSAVMLAGGPPTEDGLLQMREIVDLDLDGRIVVLSSCRSASGEVLRGEGVMGLARAFFQAGAHAVVASLWPLEDDDAARLFDRFYRHVAAGESVAGALAAAQRDRIVAGAPAAAWAGVVALGDGDLVPLPGGVRRPGVGRGILVAGALALAAVTALVVGFVGMRSRRRS